MKAVIVGLVVGGGFAAARAVVYAYTHHKFSRWLKGRDVRGDRS